MDIDAMLKRATGKEVKTIREVHLNYDSVAETLEPVYFWILDFMRQGPPGLSLEVEKLVDNFTASPGSGYFADIGMRATRMQDQGMKILATINTVMRSVLNLIYDLKEFEIRLKHYDNAKSENEKEKEAGLLALKQIWMDRVDIKRGAGSINMMAQQLDFVTLRDAFMRAKSPDDVEKIDLNERVKRVLKPRVAEFLEWRSRSERELRSRYELEKTYLKSQVNAVKLYTRWVKPYLRAAEELQMTKRELGRADLVTAFNTVIMELAILGKKEIGQTEVRHATEPGVMEGPELPEKFRNIKLKRNFHACIFVDFTFRGIPRPASRAESVHYVHGGRTEVIFKAFALNDDEYQALQEEIKKEEVFEGLKLVEGVTSDSLAPLQEDLQKYLAEEATEPEQEKTKKGFVEWLFGLEPKQTKAESAEEEKKKIRKENFIERQIREYAEGQASSACWRLYDIYKKAHGMAAPPEKFAYIPKVE